MTFHRVITIDPSLTCSGWAMFSVPSERLLSVGKLRALPPTFSMAKRLVDYQRQIEEIYTKIELNSNDVLICEAPTTMRDPRAALVVEQVRGLFETVARSIGATVPGRINPRSVQYEVMGLSGKQKKRDEVKAIALEVAIRLFGKRLTELGLLKDNGPSLKKHQDIIDAILLGSYAMNKITQAIKTGEPCEKFFSQNEQARSKRFSLKNLKVASST